ncbi:uncharacterized protein K460DRAFT_76644 [Cucurbitaria berberidis CBS 394.84]|uniref:Uncharacterized protein n=1 Tax=Cucurbitaria berberidis CBS 394.84 TaxID=1168544 RepID=A0A9P4LBP0_9PLEO|nr:uncharacterized protein K460DRAFT_76644 [Cucurbitaria berberidis CBS 394.84]KAF1848542.1 hypothetical protein K460DRAFT_76644 [Cucurbitaria berberidis CBS 394.84]
MCYILLSTCRTCTWTLRIRYTRCSHALLHNFDPAKCPNRMKRRRQSENKLCGKCAARRESLSCLPQDVEGGGNYDARQPGRKRTSGVRCAEEDGGHEEVESDGGGVGVQSEVECSLSVERKRRRKQRRTGAKAQ